MTGDVWVPANEVERRLREAAEAGDASQVLAILATAPLVLPGFAEDETPQRSRQRLLTRERDGVPYLLAFTSVETMRRTVNVNGWRATSLPELVRAWPDLDTPVPWGLAINPATPIVVLVPPEAVATLLPTPATLAPFVPHNEVERLLRDALAAPDAQVLLDVLVTAPVTVPHRSVVIDGTPAVTVFTSPERCAEYLREAGLDVPT
ncbi:MAG: SseB family protein, partial [Dactylosporangium sp.]|nr:SseB family protein [Dactylosporangium sp.]